MDEGQRQERQRRERRADAAIHLLGLLACLTAVPALLALAVAALPLTAILSLAVYAAGLVATFGFSAAYHLCPRPEWRELLRRLDHAAIFVMIAGSYTPFALVKIGGDWGWGLLALVWAVALLGVAVKLLLPRRFERSSILLYLLQGWAILLALEPLVATVSRSTLVLLALGGLLYSVGVVFHLWRRLPYHSAVWHGFVLAGAACHYAAVLDSLVLGGRSA